jgi:hypothetical protein
MVAGHIGTFEVGAGRRDEFLAVMAEAKPWLESRGAAVRIRATLIGGPESGRVSLTTLFENPAARGAYQDAVANEGPNNPLFMMVTAADPPATLVSRSLLNEIGGESEIADSPALQIGLIFAQGAGLRAEAEDALEAAKERWAGLGVRSANFRIQMGGTGAPGRLVRVMAHESWAAYEAATAANQALDEPPPLGPAVASGALTLLSQSSTIEVEV